MRNRLTLLWLLVGAISCGSTNNAGTGCIAGRIRSCSCVGGAVGEQLCLADHSYQACQCPQPLTDAGADAEDVARDVGSDVSTDAAADAPATLPGCPPGDRCDVDGDGRAGSQCGGDDCDDRDCRRFPGNAERCDVGGVDEDCMPCTVAGSSDGDHDRDTYIGSGCHNHYEGAAPACDPRIVTVDRGTALVSGRDCADDDNNRHPDQVEICNGVDDNCNALIDDDFRGGSCGSGLPGACAEGVNECRMGRLTCTPTVAPGTRTETCNAIDDDCDGSVDEEFATMGAQCRPPGLIDPTPSPCQLGRTQCVRGEVVCVGGASPERCNGRDDDCDGMVDESPEADVACSAARSVTRCASGACAIVRCERGFGDCDDDARNGCETDLSTATGHCGGCGVVCAGRCDAGWCDGGPQAIVAGGQHACALRPGGRSVCWGDNTYAQTGNGSAGVGLLSLTPTASTGVVDAIDMSTTGNRTCVLLRDHRIQCWGGGIRVPTALPVDAVTLLGQGGDDICVSRSDGQILCVRDAPRLTPLTPLASPTSISGSPFQACAVDAGGAVRCLRDTSGAGAAPWILVALSTPSRQVVVSQNSVFVVGQAGNVYSWGQNSFGELGLGDTVRRDAPTLNPTLSTITSVCLGAFHGCAVRGDGRVLCWGMNSRGQLGDGGSIDHSTPALVVGVDDATRVACSGDFSCVRRRNGQVSCWGANDHGQLGDGTTTDRRSAVSVPAF